MTSAVLSPCIGICELGAGGYCVGCHRSGDEIAAWSSLPPQQRQQLMDHVLPERAQRIARLVEDAPLWADDAGSYSLQWPGWPTTTKAQ